MIWQKEQEIKCLEIYIGLYMYMYIMYVYCMHACIHACMYVCVCMYTLFVSVLYGVNLPQKRGSGSTYWGMLTMFGPQF